MTAGKIERTPDGYTIEHLHPGFRIAKGRRHIATVNTWREAVAHVLVEREANRAIRRT